MTQGVLLFAQNNSHIDYVKQAQFCASRIKKYLQLPVCLATDNLEYLKQNYKNYKVYFDEIVELQRHPVNYRKKFRDGLYSEKTLEWRNLSRADAWDVTPFAKTIVMDTDLIISNNTLLKAFNYNQEFLIAKESIDIKTNRYIPELKRISDRSIDMYWATLFYFEKTDNTKLLFDLIKHIRDNWSFYRLTYKIIEKKFRNDFAFSIAIHIINGFKKTNWPLNMPGNLWHTLDRDILIDIKDDKFTFLLEKDWEYHAASVSQLNVHVMNKFSLNRIIDEQL